MSTTKHSLTWQLLICDFLFSTVAVALTGNVIQASAFGRNPSFTPISTAMHKVTFERKSDSDFTGGGVDREATTYYANTCARACLIYSHNHKLPMVAGGTRIALSIPPVRDEYIANTVVTVSRYITINTAASLENFLMPDTSAMTWTDAENYCRAKVKKARLPTQAELQDLFLFATSAAVAGDFNIEMCSVHNWPLGGECGGRNFTYWSSTAAENESHYSVSMISGIAYPTPNISTTQVACVR